MGDLAVHTGTERLASGATLGQGRTGRVQVSPKPRVSQSHEETEKMSRESQQRSHERSV